MIKIKTEKEIEVMREGGQILARILEEVKSQAKAGVTTKELDSLAADLIKKNGGRPSFKMVPGYPSATCMCVNEVVVHGLPSDYKLANGDLLGIDIGLYYQGFHTDTAWTVLVGDGSCRSGGFLKTGKEALRKAIEQAKVGNRVGHISKAIGETIEAAGFNPVRALVGHGIGKKLHEEPEIPCFLAGKIEKPPRLTVGMTLAIEVIYNMGKGEVVLPGHRAGKDRWTVVTKDGSLSALFEKTVAVTKEGPVVLTR